MPSTKQDRERVKELFRIHVSTPDGAKRFLAMIKDYPDTHQDLAVAARINQAHKTLRLQGTEIRPGQRTMQDEVAALDGPLTFKLVAAKLPEHAHPSLRVCLSRLAAEGVLERLSYGVYWNKRGPRPTDADVLSMRCGGSPEEKVASMSGLAVIERLRAALPAQIFRKVAEAL